MLSLSETQVNAQVVIKESIDVNGNHRIESQSNERRLVLSEPLDFKLSFDSDLFQQVNNQYFNKRDLFLGKQEEAEVDTGLLLRSFGHPVELEKQTPIKRINTREIVDPCDDDVATTAIEICLFPDLPSRRSHTRYLESLAGLVFDSFEASSTIREFGTGVPIPFGQARLYAQWIDDESGGHSHDGPPLELRGTFKDLSLAVPTEELGEINLTADLQGDVFFYFKTPEWGGRLKILADVTQTGGGIAIQELLDIRVDTRLLLGPLPTESTMELLPETGNVFSLLTEKTGGTCLHNGPSDKTTVPTECKTPDNNHFVDSDIIEGFEGAIERWDYIFQVYNLMQGIPVVFADELPVWVNDISLPRGGVFDIPATWSPLNAAGGGIGHFMHRVGRDVDIRTTRFLPGTPGGDPDEDRVGILMRPVTDSQGTRYRNLIFESVATMVGGANLIEPHGASNATPTSNGNEHYHIYFYDFN